MHVQVIDRLPAILSRINDDAVSAAQTLLPRNVSSHLEQMAKQVSMVNVRFAQRHNVLSRNDQQVYRSFGVDIAEYVTEFVLVDSARWNASFNDFAEDATHSETSVHAVSGGENMGENARANPRRNSA
jgi:hypothetical protein